MKEQNDQLSKKVKVLEEKQKEEAARAASTARLNKTPDKYCYSGLKRHVMLDIMQNIDVDNVQEGKTLYEGVKELMRRHMRAQKALPPAKFTATGQDMRRKLRENEAEKRRLYRLSAENSPIVDTACDGHDLTLGINKTDVLFSVEEEECETINEKD